MKNVSKKLLKAIEQVGGKVTKTGYNSFSKYKYITESDINEAVLPALLSQGLLMTTSVESVMETPSGPDNKNRFCTVQLVHTIIDTESGETLTLKSAGTAADSLDKSIFKALTGACKYFMLKTFMISGDDSDPENDGATAPVQQPANKGFGKKPEVVAPVQEKKGFMAKKIEAAAPMPQLVKTEQKKPNFGKKAETAPQQVIEAEVVETTEEDAAY